MKNISLSINPNAVTNISPLNMPGPMPINKMTSVSLNVQFDSEMEALAFTKFMIENVLNYKAGGV